MGLLNRSRLCAVILRPDYTCHTDTGMIIEKDDLIAVLDCLSDYDIETSIAFRDFDIVFTPPIDFKLSGVLLNVAKRVVESLLIEHGLTEPRQLDMVEQCWVDHAILIQEGWSGEVARQHLAALTAKGFFAQDHRGAPIILTDQGYRYLQRITL